MTPESDRKSGQIRAVSGSGLIEGYAWQDSNLRPLGPQPNALSPELQAHATCATDILPLFLPLLTEKVCPTHARPHAQI